MTKSQQMRWSRPRRRSPAPSPLRRLQRHARFQLRPAVPGRRSRLRAYHGGLIPNRSTLPSIAGAKPTPSSFPSRCVTRPVIPCLLCLPQSCGSPPHNVLRIRRIFTLAAFSTRSSQLRSAVMTVACRSHARARHARSPSDSPNGFVRGRSSPVRKA